MLGNCYLRERLIEGCSVNQEKSCVLRYQDPTPKFISAVTSPVERCTVCATQAWLHAFRACHEGSAISLVTASRGACNLVTNFCWVIASKSMGTWEVSPFPVQKVIVLALLSRLGLDTNLLGLKTQVYQGILHKIPTCHRGNSAPYPLWMSLKTKVLEHMMMLTCNTCSAICMLRSCCLKLYHTAWAGTRCVWPESEMAKMALHKARLHLCLDPQ